MIVIEGLEHVCVHTGDFRFYPELCENSTLRRALSADLFLDVTFGASKISCQAFPSKEDSVHQLLDLVDEQDPSENVVLHSFGLGDEPLLAALATHRKELLFAEKTRLDVLTCTCPELILNASCILLADDVPPNHLQGRIIVASPKSIANLKQRGIDGIHIKCSALWWVRSHNSQFDAAEPVCDFGVWHIPFSMHSSLSELRRFVAMMRPRSITPICACASGDDIAIDLLDQPALLTISVQGAVHNPDCAKSVWDTARETRFFFEQCAEPDTLANLLDSQAELNTDDIVPCSPTIADSQFDVASTILEVTDSSGDESELSIASSMGSSVHSDTLLLKRRKICNEQQQPRILAPVISCDLQDDDSEDERISHLAAIWGIPEAEAWVFIHGQVPAQWKRRKIWEYALRKED